MLDRHKGSPLTSVAETSSWKLPLCISLSLPLSCSPPPGMGPILKLMKEENRLQ